MEADLISMGAFLCNVSATLASVLHYPSFILLTQNVDHFQKKENLGFQDLYTHIPPTSSAIASVLCIHQISFNAKMGGSGLGAKLVLKDRKVRIRFFLGIGRLRLEG